MTQTIKEPRTPLIVRTNDTCRTSLYGDAASEYGPSYREHFFEQYKLFAQSVNYTSEMKLKINSYFLTINTALVTASGISFSKQVDASVWHYLLPLAGIFISLIWWGVTYTYKIRNVIKLRILHCLEEKLPLALYGTEWKLMDENHAGLLKKFFFKVDLFIPFVFALSYLIFIFLS